MRLARISWGLLGAQGTYNTRQRNRLIIKNGCGFRKIRMVILINAFDEKGKE
jgi:hypothetical protein